MLCKLFMVTYNDSVALNRTLSSCLEHGHSESYELQITIINNHSNLYIYPEFRDLVTVLNNQTRADFSNGHLARDYNAAIVNGFVDVNAPACDLLITSQDDVDFQPDWLKYFALCHKTGLQFISMGMGDMVCSYTIDAVRSIGMWDERFCGVGYQEEDYFRRAVRALGERCSINDYAHKRLWNPLYEDEEKDEFQFCARHERDDEMRDRRVGNHGGFGFHGVCQSWLYEKWGSDCEKSWATQDFSGAPMRGMNFFYPYFELRLPNLSEKGYPV